MKKIYSNEDHSMRELREYGWVAYEIANMVKKACLPEDDLTRLQKIFTRYGLFNIGALENSVRGAYLDRIFK